ncbi:MAG: ABC transporter permease [Ruminiclostridium sp.]|nr:ABC transporter permease [Ruminiclostridium sp.]
MLRKSIFRTIRQSLGRYLAILSIIALGVGFFAGLRLTEDSMHATGDRYLHELNLYDFRLISTLGLTAEDAAAFEELAGIEKARASVSADVIVLDSDGSEQVLHGHTMLDGINGLDVCAGRLPEKPNECVLDGVYVSEEDIGKKVVLSDSNTEDVFDTFSQDEYVVVGIVNAAEYVNYQRGTTSLGDGTVGGFLYLTPEGFSTDYYTEIYLTLSEQYEIHSEAYENALDEIRPSVEDLLQERADLRFADIYDEAKAELDDGKATLQEKKDELNSGQREINAGWSAYQTKKVETEKQLQDSKAALDAARAELDQGWAALEGAKQDPSAEDPAVQEQLAAQEAQLNAAEAEYSANLAAYEQGAATAKAEFSKTEKKLNAGQKEINNAKPAITEAEEELADAEQKLAEIEKPTVYVLDRSTNPGYVSFENDSRIVSGVAKVFPVFFFLVAALVCTTTMTRMVGEQRTQNGVLKALGYKNFSIASQYLVYAGSASILGCVSGFLLGAKLMPMVLWTIYRMMYAIDRPAAFVFDPQLLAVSTALYLVCILGVTYLVCRADLRTCAAGLMRPTAPSAGKRILLERIGFIWRPMKFLHKVSVRNILRYKKRMVMMIIGIGGCTALLITGFGIRDSIQPIVIRQFEEIDLYNASVSFLETPTEEEREAFRTETRDFAAGVGFVYRGNIDLVGTEETRSVSLAVSDEDLSEFVDLHSGETKIPFPGKGEAVLSIGAAERLGIVQGDKVTLRDSDYREMTVTVSGVYDNFVGDTIYLTAETYEEGLGTAAEINGALLLFGEDIEEHKAGADLMNMDNIASVSILSDMEETVTSMLSSMNLVIVVVLICAGALAFIVLYNLTNITITERVREIATLKVLGFRRKEQESYVFRENIILTAISALCGVPMGIGLLTYTMSQIVVEGVYFGCRVAMSSLLWSVGLTLVFTVVVDLALAGKLRKINMAEAMKAIE